MTRRTPFRAADLTRAIIAAQKAGLKVNRAEIDPDGRIVVSELPAPESAVSPLDAWLSGAGRNEGAA